MQICIEAVIHLVIDLIFNLFICLFWWLDQFWFVHCCLMFCWNWPGCCSRWTRRGWWTCRRYCWRNQRSS